eukprot:13802-Heterococcus_DN1.PRE.2
MRTVYWYRLTEYKPAAKHARCHLAQLRAMATFCKHCFSCTHSLSKLKTTAQTAATRHQLHKFLLFVSSAARRHSVDKCSNRRLDRPAMSYTYVTCLSIVLGTVHKGSHVVTAQERALHTLMLARCSSVKAISTSIQQEYSYSLATSAEASQRCTDCADRGCAVSTSPTVPTIDV